MRARLVVSMAVISACGGDPHVLNGFRSPMGVNGMRGHAHSGVDFKGDHGDPVLAAADGVVVGASEDEGAGKRILLGHGSPEIRRSPLPPSYLATRPTYT